MSLKIDNIMLVLIIFSSLLLSSTGFQEDNFLDGQLTLIVEDTLDDSSGQLFTQRSLIHIRSIKSGNAVISHTRDWTEDHSEVLEDISRDDGLYKIRILQKGAEEKGYVSTFTKACLVLESGLSEILTIMLDSTGGSLVGVGLHTQVLVCEGMENIHSTSFNSTVFIRSPIQAPIPDTATYIQKIDAMKSEKAEGKDNRSFLAKYWMYIVPVVLILLISGNQDSAAAGGK